MRLFIAISALVGACAVHHASPPAGGDASNSGSDGAVMIDPSDPCSQLSADPSPTANHAQIQGCLDTKGYALLAPGTYPIDDAIRVPGGTLLRSSGASRPTLTRVPGSAGNTLLSLTGDGARVSDLALDGNNVFPGGCCDSVVAIDGNDNTLENAQVFNADMPPAGSRPVGIYVICTACTGNMIRNVDIFNTFYGVILRPARPAGSAPPNTIDHSTIHDVKCDSVTFIGHGAVTNSELFHNGWDCENGPIPGGGIYTLQNDQGGLIRGNTIHDNCGNGLDLVESSSFDIEDNHIYDPGYQWGNTRAYCAGLGVGFFVMSNSTLRNNIIENNDRPWNAVSFPGWIDWFRPTGGTPWSDLPGGAHTVIAFLLAKDPASTYNAIGNVIDQNQMRASCSGNCLGVGYMATRGTGLVNGDWNASTTNYFTSNDPFGSNVGSSRCGGNWYAANSVCPAGGATPCNLDDYQHTLSSLRNDDCRDY